MSLTKATHRVIAPIAFKNLTSSYTVTSEDAGTILLVNISSPETGVIRLPTNLSIGTQVTVIQIGTGQTSFEGINGSILRTTDNFTKLYKQWSVATAIYVSQNNWVLAGDITA